MTIEFSCQHCGKLIKTKDELAGRMGRCPHCKGTMQIPESNAAGETVDDPFEFASSSTSRAKTPQASARPASGNGAPGAGTSNAGNNSGGKQSSVYQGPVYQAKTVVHVSPQIQNRMVYANAAAIIAIVLSVCGYLTCGCLIPFMNASAENTILPIFAYVGLGFQILACPIAIGATWMNWELWQKIKPGEPARRTVLISMIVSGVAAIMSGITVICMIGILLSFIEETTGISIGRRRR